MTTTKSASSVLFVLLLAAHASAEVQKAPARSKAVAGAATPVQSAAAPSTGHQIAVAVAALSEERRKDEKAVMATINAVVGTSIGSDVDSLLLALLEYQRLVNKEASADAKLSRAMKLERLKSKGNALDAAMNEARDKASVAMEAATAHLVTGMIASMVTTGAAVGSGAGGASGNTAAPWRGSDLALAATAEQAAATNLPPTARAAVERQIEPLLTRSVKAWDEKTSVAAAIAAALASEVELTLLDRENVLAYALCRAHRRAIDDLELAIKAKKAGRAATLKMTYGVALKRLRLTLAGVRFLAKSLSRKDP